MNNKMITLLCYWLVCLLLFPTTIVYGSGTNASELKDSAPLTRIEITPNDFSVYPGAQPSFTATGFDIDDNVVPLIDPVWTVSGGPFFTDGNVCNLEATDIGNHTISCTKDGVTGTATFKILGPLHHITITPDTAKLKVDETVELTATGYDEFNNRVSFQNLEWSTTGGLITNITAYTILYTATSVGNHSVTATDQGITSTILILVTAIYLYIYNIINTLLLR